MIKENINQPNKIGKTIHDRNKFRSISILVTYITLMIVAAIIFSKYVDRESLQEVVKHNGEFGIILYFLIEVVYVTFTPLLNTFVLIASGYIFGGHLGFIKKTLSFTTY